MAKTETKTETKVETKVEERVTVRLPRALGTNANQDEFFSVNFKNFIIRRGERVEIPVELAEVIENADKAEEYAIQYAEANGVREAK